MLYGTWPFAFKRVDNNHIYSLIKQNVILFDYKNIYVSPQVKELISKMLKYDTKKRIDWEELFNHPLFKDSNE